MEIKICPRCGGRISWVEKRVVGGNTYFYAVHEWRENGRRKRRKCYLGPDVYTYVTMTHETDGLYLEGLVDRKRLIKYLETILQKIQDLELEPNEKLEIAEKLRKTAEKLEKQATQQERK